MKKFEVGRATNAATTVKVVITEEEYQLLLTLKKKAEARTPGKWDDPNKVHVSHKFCSGNCLLSELLVCWALGKGKY